MFAQGRNINHHNFVLSQIPEIDILNFYLGIKEVPCLINSPLRVDKNPSFGIHSNDGIKIKFKDFSTQESGGTFDLLMKYFHLSYCETIDKIYEDMAKGYTKNDAFIVPQRTKGHTQYSTNKDLRCKIREWQKYDLDYWESYGISLPWLKFGRIYPVSHIILIDKDNNKKYTFKAEKYAYAYVEFKDNEESLKIYQPFSLHHKWSNKHDSSVWDLWQQLPEKGENLIITSSRKDALCIWENTLIPSTGLQAESYLPKEHIVEELKNRFKNVFILYDNDFNKEKNYGYLLGKKLSEKYNLTQLTLPDWLNVKDTSDLCKRYGRKMTKTIINQLIKNNG